MCSMLYNFFIFYFKVTPQSLSSCRQMSSGVSLLTCSYIVMNDTAQTFTNCSDKKYISECPLL